MVTRLLDSAADPDRPSAKATTSSTFRAPPGGHRLPDVQELRATLDGAHPEQQVAAPVTTLIVRGRSFTLLRSKQG